MKTLRKRLVGGPTLLLLILLVGCGSGESATSDQTKGDGQNAPMTEAERQQSAAQWVKQKGGMVFYDYEVDESLRPIEGAKPPGSDRVAALKVVALDNPDVSDVTRLSNMKKLRWLELDETVVSDLSPLESCTGLEELFLNYTYVTDLAPLSKLKNLRWLELGYTKVSDLSPLENLTNLEQLSLNNTRVTNLSSRMRELLTTSRKPSG